MIKRYFKLIIGLFLMAFGTVITLNANLGYSPWNVFHHGLGEVLNIQIGTANIIIGVIIVGIGVLYKKIPGIGTILNMFLVGAFINLIIYTDIIPIFSNIYIRIITLPIALIIMSLGSYMYMKSGLGIGPRDGLMLILLEKTNKSIRFIKNAMEITVLIIGFLLGGPVGIGTIITSFGIGFAIQFVFEFFNFNPNKVEHRSWNDEIKTFKDFISNNKL